MPGYTEVVWGDLQEGFAYPDIRYVLITESDMFGAVKKEKEEAKGSRPERCTHIGPQRAEPRRLCSTREPRYRHIQGHRAYREGRCRQGLHQDRVC